MSATPRLLALLLLVGACVLGGCGIGVQAEHERLAAPRPSTGTAPPPSFGDAVLEIYFVRDARLVAVEREAPAATPEVALALLVAGPSEQERQQGIRSALPPTDIGSWACETFGDVAVVDAPPQLSTLTGENQLLGIAQVVWTLSAIDGTREVLLAVDGELIAVPTDAGLTGAPVTRDDFATVAPAPGATETPGGPATGTASPAAQPPPSGGRSRRRGR